MKAATCKKCGQLFAPNKPWQIYCSDRCRDHSRVHVRLPVMEKVCDQCGRQFLPSGRNGRVAKVCSDECRKTKAKSVLARHRADHPEKWSEYYRRSIEKMGGDLPLKRLWRAFPDVPRKCEACGDDRVLDIAHKPHASRNGERRNRKNTNPDTVWVLCPTCHALMDRKKWSPSKLGVSRK